MSKASVFKKDGKTSGNVQLSDAVFGSRVNQRLLDIVVTAYGGNLHRGTHDTKTKAEVRGGGRKPWRQKGTGRARHGSRRSPIWRGGGSIFGPHPRSYFTRLSDGMKRSALVSALSHKNHEKDLMVLEDAKIEQPKTRELVALIKALKLDDLRTLLVVENIDVKLKRAYRNIEKRCSVVLARDVNAYHIVRRKKLLIEKTAIPILEKRALGEPAAAPVKTEKAAS